MISPREYGLSPGGYRLIAPDSLTLKLRNGGLDVSKPSMDLDEGGTPYCLNMRLDRGGVTPDYAITAFDAASASAADKNIVHMAPFELTTGTKMMMRCRPTRWDRWNGVNWLELPGLLSGTSSDKLYTVAYNNPDRFIAANGIDRLKAWDGVDGNAIADLSADSPIAFYITKVGTRILAARIKVGATIFPYDLAWCADGNIFDWTTAASGAGGTTLYAEGTNEKPNIITGLSNLEGVGAIYRQRSIVMALLTGLGASPFKFTTVDFSHGTESPYSIASGGMVTGDYFLGEDYMVYHFDGRNRPTAIGEPIYEIIRNQIYNPNYVVGRVEARTQTYWLAYPTDSTLLLKQAFVFSIREWQRSQRLMWWKRDLGAGYRSMGYGTIPTTTDPIVDTVFDIVDTVSRRVDDFANTQGDERVVFGDTVGQAYYVDTSALVTTGVWHSKTIGDGQTNFTVGRVRLTGKASSVAVVRVSVSTDGGLNFGNAKDYNFPVGGSGTVIASDYFGIDATLLQFQLEILSGTITINELAYVIDSHGRAN